MFSAASAAVGGLFGGKEEAVETGPTEAELRKAKEKDKKAKIRAKFKELDLDKSGSLDVEELVVLLMHVTGGTMPRSHLERLFHQIDKDHSGSVDLDEFLAYMFKRGETREEAARREKRQSLDASQQLRADRKLRSREGGPGEASSIDAGDKYWQKSVLGSRPDARGHRSSRSGRA